MKTGPLPKDVETSLTAILEPGETALRALTTLAGTLVLTNRRVVIVREGRSYRPATGIRSWELSAANTVNYGQPRGGVGRLTVGSGRKVTSFFFKERDSDAALEIVSMAHQMTYVAIKGW
jgi:hypothetical protein